MGRFVVLLLSLAALPGAAPYSPPHPSPDTGLPFFVGERVTYRVSVAKLGRIGRGEMLVEGPESVRGRETLLFRFDFRSRVGFITAEDRTRSWFDPQRMASLRFEKFERHPLSSQEQEVELFPEQRRWSAADGQSGGIPSEKPLDELSFLYFIRTLPLEPGTAHELDRYFDAERNPVVVRVIRRERVTVPAGEFPTVLVEMRVKDPQRYQGEGIIRLNISDDPCRLLVRLESAFPVFGSMVLAMESHTHPAQHRTAD